MGGMGSNPTIQLFYLRSTRGRIYFLTPRLETDSTIVTGNGFKPVKK